MRLSEVEVFFEMAARQFPSLLCGVFVRLSCIIEGNICSVVLVEYIKLNSIYSWKGGEVILKGRKKERV